MSRKKRAAKDSRHTHEHSSHKYHYFLWIAALVALGWSVFLNPSKVKDPDNPPPPAGDIKVTPDLPIVGAGGKALQASNPNDEKKAMLQRAFENFAKKLNPSRIAAVVNMVPSSNNGEKIVQKDGSKIRQLLPPTSGGSPKEDFFGVVEEDTDPVKYLYLHLSLNGADSLITPYERRRSSFFEAVQGIDFWGPMVLPNNQNVTLKDKAISAAGFDSTQYDYFKSFTYYPQEKKYFGYNPVYVSPSSVGFWRYDQWQQSILLEASACPWNKAFYFQRIQFYYFTASQKLGANIYCKVDPEDPSWSYIGYTVMSLRDDQFNPESDDY